MKPDQERVRHLLTDTVTLLCKNGLQYQKELRVQGLLGITLDDSDVFVVHINEKFGDTFNISTIYDETGNATTVGVASESNLEQTMGEVQCKKKIRHKSAVVTPNAWTPGKDCADEPTQRTSSSWSEKRALHQHRTNSFTVNLIDTSATNAAAVKVKEEKDDLMIIEDKTQLQCDLLPAAPHTTVDTSPVIETSVTNIGGAIDMMAASVDPGGGGGGGIVAMQVAHLNPDQYSSSSVERTDQDQCPNSNVESQPVFAGMSHHEFVLQGSSWDSTGMAAGYDVGPMTAWDQTQMEVGHDTADAEHSFDSVQRTNALDGSHRQSARALKCEHENCGKTFSAPSSLVRHQVQFHGRLPLRQFYSRRSSKRLDKAYICNFPGCGKSYFAYNNLRQHQKLKHHEEKRAAGYMR